MKRVLAALLIAILAFSTTALAATYRHDELTFDYNEEFFTITMDDRGDDQTLVILTDKNENSIKIFRSELKDNESFPAAEDIAQALNVEVQKMDVWGNFRNVLTYTTTSEDNYTESVFIAPVVEKDGDIDEIVTVTIGGYPVKDEEAAALSSDWTSEVVDTLKVIDD